MKLFKKDEHDPRFHRVRMAERSKASDLTIRSPSEIPGSNPAGPLMKFVRIFFIIGDKNSLSYTELYYTRIV